MIKIASIFNSIQGEGLNCGKATTFVRLHTNNCFPNGNRCKFCDTITQEYYKPQLCLEDLHDHLQTHLPNMVSITGGEIFSISEEDLDDLTHDIKDYVDYMEIETNGSYLIENLSFKLISILSQIDNINISPKLSNSGVGWLYDYKKLNQLVKIFGDKLQFKFVAGNKKDLNEIFEFIYEAHEIENKNVWIMPRTPSTLETQKMIVDYCIENEYNFSPRLHIDLWGEDCKEDK